MKYLTNILIYYSCFITCVNARNNFTKSIYPCIPVLGFGAISDPVNFIPRLSASIDFCIHNFVLVKYKSLNLTESIQLLTTSKHIHNLTVINHESWIFSVSEGWNLVLKTFPNQPWYAIVAYDVEFRPNQLEKFSLRFWNESRTYQNTKKHVHSNSSETNFAFVNWENIDMAPGGWNFFALTNHVVKVLGYFDENMFPANFEDVDYGMRMNNWHHLRSKIFLDIKYWHGAKSDTGYIPGTSYIRKTVPTWHLLMDKGWNWNVKYLSQKWGCQIIKKYPINCTYIRPYGNLSNPLSYWIQEEDHMDILLQESKMSPRAKGINITKIQYQ